MAQKRIGKIIVDERVGRRLKNADRLRDMSLLGNQPAFDPPAYDEQQPAFTPIAPPNRASGYGPSPGNQSTGIDNLDFTPSPLELPTTAECITHLKLLHAFAKLREDVGNCDGLFGISCPEVERFVKDNSTAQSNDGHQPSGVHGQNTSETNGSAPVIDGIDRTTAALAERIREKRWTVYVTRAVHRFEKWWQSYLMSFKALGGKPLQTDDFDESLAGISYLLADLPISFPSTGENGPRQISAESLPPLDVLMVWHAYMLNPRTYLEDCMRLSKRAMWRSAFPWKLINDCISKDTFEYNPPQSAIDSFKINTALQWSNTIIEGDPKGDQAWKDFWCPKCLTNVTVPWTQPPKSTEPRDVEQYLDNDTGYASPSFRSTCPSCNLEITHDRLRVGHFIADAEALRTSKTPMPGTILGEKGTPQMTAKGKGIGTHDPFFPNRAIENFPDLFPATLREKIAILSIDDIRLVFQNLLSSPTDTQIINADQKRPELVAKESKIAIKKMLSHYWDNSSYVLGIDLVGAVLRQGVFVQKMRKLNWYKSPGVVTTCQRLIVKYHRFTRIIGDNKKVMAVPTLDVDLAWSYTLAETGKFLNHDDKVPESTLNTAFQNTSRLYESKYGTPYSECTCWYCECTREPIRSSFLNKFIPRRSDVQDISAMSEKGFTKDAAHGMHVSSHNAVMLPGSSGFAGTSKDATMTAAQQRRQELEELDLVYAKVCKRYKKSKKKDEAPSRDNDYYVYGAYGYPIYYPVYVPYYSDPGGAGEHHQHGVGAGGANGGGCVAGACAASTSLGACSGGSGTPGCQASCGGAGSASGGCGSGGCGGGGGGGGGGCGGGGGGSGGG